MIFNRRDGFRRNVTNDHRYYRLATEPYKKPSNENMKNLFMHLTNYSVNKHSEMYIDNENYGSKRWAIELIIAHLLGSLSFKWIRNNYDIPVKKKKNCLDE